MNLMNMGKDGKFRGILTLENTQNTDISDNKF